ENVYGVYLGEGGDDVVFNSHRLRNSFVNIDKSSSGVDIKSGLIKLSDLEAKMTQTYIDAGWADEKLDDGTPVWILENGKYPRLLFETEQYILIKEDNIYYSYKDNEFIELEPTEENFEEYSVNLIELLTPNEQGIKPLILLENPEIV